ncbi:MAG: glycosyl hydrolase 53 family protein [Chloroflexi bacterium]|nr:glycosyl hydrolase 53 family protein [Chloroflexota bacterium]
MKKGFGLILLLLVLMGGSSRPSSASPTQYYFGVDLSYVNEMEDCGATYRVNGEPRDPYQIFADYGANLVRIRLWNNPTWTNYSNFDDVVRSLQRANALGLNVLLDFHYSDTWADPNHQTIPAAWANMTDLNGLGQALYQYTYDTLMQLDALGLMPEIVQVGNEINTEILRPEDSGGYPIDWDRNAFLLNQAIQAVRDAGTQASESPQIMLHIAKPESVEGWLLAATDAGVTDFDIIGISYYPGWSTHTVTTVGNVISQLRYKFGKEVMIAETAYPWTLDGVRESASNILGQDFIVPSYPATPAGQKQFLIDLTQTVFANGGLGIVYWEPAWVSTSCHTLWGQGSHWENATFFDFNNDNEILPSIEFPQYPYEYPVNVMLQFNLQGDSLPDHIFFWGDFTGFGKRPMLLPLVNGAYTLQARLMPGTEIHYQFYEVTPASPENALLSTDCMDDEGHTSITVPTDDLVIQHTVNTCPAVTTP